MEIKKVTDAAFKKYGRVISHVDVAELVAAHLLAVAQRNHVAGQSTFVIGIYVVQKVGTLAHTVEL